MTPENNQNPIFFTAPESDDAKKIRGTKDNEKILPDLSGWLMFYLVVFALIGISFINSFFTAISMPVTAATIITAVFSPLISISSIASVIFISMRKKLAILVSIIAIAITTAYSIIGAVGTAVTTSKPIAIPALIGTILTSIVVGGLYALYFIVSKRVKQILVEK